MIPFLRVWLGALRANSPGLPLCVLPFGEEISEVPEFCRNMGVQYHDETTADWVELGRRLYKEENYRGDTPRAWYLSKMAPFTGPFDTFLFVDANVIILEDISFLEEKFESSDYDILFRFRAGEFRNIKNEQLRDEWNKITPNLKNGYNANFFISRRNCMSLEKCREFIEADPDLRNKFGTAGVQGIMTYFIVMERLKADTVLKIWKKSQGASCRNDFTISPEGEILKPDSPPVMFIKWNGTGIGPDMPNFEVFSRLQSKFALPE